MAARRRSVVAIANEEVDIVAACRLVGMDIPDGFAQGRAIKLFCPFGSVSHSDGGAERAFRIYLSDNSAWCFAGCGFFSPVWLVATAWDCDQVSAATDLLERVGYRPPNLAAAWRKAVQIDEVPDQIALRQALATFCRRICPDWDTAQFDPVVAATFSRCLDLLPRVHTEAGARSWLHTVKTVMGTALRAAVPAGSALR